MSKTTTTAAFAALLLGLAAVAGAQRGDDSERKSKNGHVEGEVAGVAVSVDFGRPKVAGRSIWGGLVPYGKVWRTGADEATTVKVGADVEVGGKPLAAGTYALFTIPGEGSWTVIFNRVAEQWGAFRYDQGQDALRVTVEPREHEHVEELDFALGEGAILLRWEELEVPIPIAPPG